MAEIEVLEVKSGDEPSDNKAQYCLYGSQTLAAWGARMWEFSIGLVSRLHATQTCTFKKASLWQMLEDICIAAQYISQEV